MPDPDPTSADDLGVETPSDDAAEQREPVDAAEEADQDDTDEGDLPVEVDPADHQEQQRSAGATDEDDYR